MNLSAIARTHWPCGTQMRLCFELALETTARRGNVSMLGPQHERPPTADAPHGWLIVAHPIKERGGGPPHMNPPKSDFALILLGFLAA